MERRDVEYFSDQVSIRGWLYEPGTGGPSPAVLFCPGYSGTRYAAFYQPYIERLVSAGYAVLLSDYRGWGDSGGTRGVIDPRLQTDDLRAGISFLETVASVDAARIGLLGVSYGGGHATYVNAVDERVRTAAAISAVGDGEVLLRSMRREYEWYEFLAELGEERRRVVTGAEPRLVHPNEDIQIPTPERRSTKVKGAVDPSKTPTQTPLLNVQAILEYAPRRVAAETRRMLWICTEHDDVVPSHQSRLMFELAPQPKRLVVLPGGGHYRTYIEHLDRNVAEILSWFEQHLGSPQPSVFEV
jgi:dipeptidyl aminopeptidase/acylaminoacyl peptidase